MFVVDPRAAAAALDGPDGEGPPRWLAALERAQALTHRAARAIESASPSEHDLGPAARAIEAAIEAIFVAYDNRPTGRPDAPGPLTDRLQATRTAQTALGRAGAALAGAAASDPGIEAAIRWLREARRELTAAEERFARMPPEIPPAAAEVRANKGVPGLHRLARATLVPVLKPPEPLVVPEPMAALPVPTTREELDEVVAEVKRRSAARREAWKAKAAERARAKQSAHGAEEAVPPPPGFVAPLPKPLGEDGFVAARTRECFEEVVAAGLQRAPLAGDAWRDIAVIEQRLIAAIDGIAALGARAVARIEPLVKDSPAVDPARGFAALLVLGCIEGRDALAAAERILHHLGPSSPAVLAAAAAALKLVPSPSLPIALRTLLADDDAALRKLAVEVLAYRGLATAPELAAAAADADAEIAAAALPALGLLRAPDLRQAIDAALVRGQPALAEAAWTAMALAGHPRAAEAPLEALAGPLGDRAALAAALVADAHDAAALLDRAREAPTPGLVAALGWAGSHEAVALLIDLLGHREPTVQLAAAEALDRITGAGLVEEVEVAPEAIMVPDVDDPDVGEPKPPPLARAISDPRDRPSEGSNDTITRPTLRPEAWHAHWVERREHYRPNLRYRRGQAYFPGVSLWELDAASASFAERRLLQRELVARTGQHVRFDPHDFVAVQEAALREWEPIARRASATPGAWSRFVARLD